MKGLKAVFAEDMGDGLSVIALIGDWEGRIIGKSVLLVTVVEVRHVTVFPLAGHTKLV